MVALGAFAVRADNHKVTASLARGANIAILGLNTSRDGQGGHFVRAGGGKGVRNRRRPGGFFTVFVVISPEGGDYVVRLGQVLDSLVDILFVDKLKSQGVKFLIRGFGAEAAVPDIRLVERHLLGEFEHRVNGIGASDDTFHPVGVALGEEIISGVDDINAVFAKFFLPTVGVDFDTAGHALGDEVIFGKVGWGEARLRCFGFFSLFTVFGIVALAVDSPFFLVALEDGDRVR